ncbi:hypothetical protein CFter6_4799 [Collimonas fungivorans]|uniref:Uncharacterized protein n=1 Tax=Collimonas fungivorans TaxID=158899 RepID=A0A127PHV3_9BURK|nr:hypothetical protein CFter6_4799 [Collimonas fungivorans]
MTLASLFVQGLQLGYGKTSGLQQCAGKSGDRAGGISVGKYCCHRGVNTKRCAEPFEPTNDALRETHL